MLQFLCWLLVLMYLGKKKYKKICSQQPKEPFFWPFQKLLFELWSPNTSRYKKVYKTKKFPFDEIYLEYGLRFELEPLLKVLEPKNWFLRNFTIRLLWRQLRSFVHALRSHCLSPKIKNMWNVFLGCYCTLLNTKIYNFDALMSIKGGWCTPPPLRVSYGIQRLPPLGLRYIDYTDILG